MFQIIRDKESFKVLYAKGNYSFSNQGLKDKNKIINISIFSDIYEILSVDDVPSDFVGNWYTYDEVNNWTKTQFGLNEEAKIAASKAGKTKEEQNKIINSQNLKNDSIINFLKNNNLDQIETYVEDQFSSLVSMTDIQIDDYIDTNIIADDSVKAALKTIAKDTAQSVKLLQIVTKIAVHLIKKEL